jgi:hypothetical protein
MKCVYDKKLNCPQKAPYPYLFCLDCKRENEERRKIKEKEERLKSNDLY